MKNKTTFIFILIVFLSFLTVKGNTSESKKIKIVFRFDDHYLLSNSFNDSLLLIFKQHKIPFSLGIVTYNIDGTIANKMSTKELNDFKSRIKRNEIEITLHGYSHVDNELNGGSLFIKRYASEFAGLDYNKQLKKIYTAKKFLDSLLDIQVHIFVPPWDSYDKNTLKALEALKFDIISSDINGVTNGERINYIPFTLDEFSQLSKQIENHKNENVTIVILFHPYSFKECYYEYPNNFSKRITFKQLDKLLDWISKQDYVVPCTFSAVNKMQRYDEYNFKANSRKYNLLFNLLDKLSLYRKGVYSAIEYTSEYRILLIVGNLFFHLCCFGLFYLLTVFFIRASKIKIKAVYKLYLIVTLILLFLDIYYFYSPMFLIMSIFIGFSLLAVLLGILFEHKKSLLKDSESRISAVDK
jgi:peptidoglycan/xylan/chitin deacetylase (PgdA/CDA1 family)